MADKPERSNTSREISLADEPARFDKPSRLEQLRLLTPIGVKNMVDDEVIRKYLVPTSWWSQYKDYLDGQGGEAGPGPIDLKSLLTHDGELREDLEVDRDFILMEDEAWRYLEDWYGIVGSDEAVSRCIYLSEPDTWTLELRPTTFYISLFTPPKDFTPIREIASYLRKDFGDFSEKVKYEFDIPSSNQIRFWHQTNSSVAKIENLKHVLATPRVRATVGTVTQGSKEFVIESRGTGGDKWPLDSLARMREGKEKSKAAGTMGLQNLGNTCYMASAIQCLSHAEELTKYFVSNAYSTELNTDNPLGYSGRVATAYGRLLNGLYALEGPRSIAPREFKNVIGNINPSFGGYQQQDSQELLAFVLDALHEDLNRIIQKPATNRPEIGNLSPEELLVQGEEAWRLHKLRNDSVIVDLFQGVYKSTLVCPVCQKVSVTFDPFLDLSLPLPFKSYWTHPIIFIPLHGRPKRLDLELEKNSSIALLISTISQKVNVPEDRLVGAEVWNHKLYKVYGSYMPVTEIEKSDQAYFYELPSPDPRFSKDSRSLLLPVYTTKSSKRGNGKAEEITFPQYLLFTEEECKSLEAIERKLLAAYSRFTTSVDLTACFQPKKTNSDLDGDESSDSPAEDVHGIKEMAPPFEIKVQPEKFGYGRAPDAIPLSSRIPQPTSFPTPPEDNDDVMFREIDGEPDNDDNPYDTREEDYSPKRSFFHADDDVGVMKDASDDEEYQPSASVNDDLVARYLVTSNKGQANSIPTPPEDPVDSMPEEVILLRKGDTILCEWPELAYAQIFSEEQGDTLAGKSLWDDIEILDNEELLRQRELRADDSDRPKSLDDCLDEFSKEEPLDEHNTWYCPQCKEHRRANKTFELWRTGDILVFHLKRFSNSRSLSDKIDAEITFPVRGLDLSARLGERKVKSAKDNEDLESCIYDLFAVVNHYGGLGGGHYTAFAKTFHDGNFYNFNGKPPIYTLQLTG